MKVAVLTLTRDRLDYTKHCFGLLHAIGGISYDHYVLDQGSQDGTRGWLADVYRPHFMWAHEGNMGISRGLNLLLDALNDDYDVVVKFDNDCELTTPGTLKTAATLVRDNPNWILSPKIEGLNNSVTPLHEVVLDGHRVGVLPAIGGIFLAAPASLYDDYRHDVSNPVWGLDDANLGSYWRQHGNSLGYLLDAPAWHYETTRGQERRYPDYFERKYREYRGR